MTPVGIKLTLTFGLSVSSVGKFCLVQAKLAIFNTVSKGNWKCKIWFQRQLAI